MSTFVEKFGSAKNKPRKKVSVPEYKIRDHQLRQGRDEFDEDGLVLRHASQAWHDSYRCWNRYKVHNCAEPWDHVKRTEQNSCYWCPKFAEERNEQANLDGIRFIPPAKMSTYCKPVDSSPGVETGVYMPFAFRKLLENWG